MSSKIEQIITEIEDYIASCKPQPFSNSRIVVNKEEIEELLVELRMRIPEEVKQYQKIISNQDAILAEAHAEADKTMKEAHLLGIIMTVPVAILEQILIKLTGYRKVYFR